jgi:hypothetical protein
VKSDSVPYVKIDNTKCLDLIAIQCGAWGLACQIPVQREVPEGSARRSGCVHRFHFRVSLDFGTAWWVCFSNLGFVRSTVEVCVVQMTIVV